MRTSNGSVAGFPLPTVKCALLLLFVCVGSPVIPAFGEEDHPIPLPALPDVPGPPSEPQEVHERGTPDLAKEFDLSPQEALILQPLLHKLSTHRTAERVLVGQRSFRIKCLDTRLQYFERARELGTAGALNNIKRFNAYKQELLNLWRGGINCDPAKASVRVWLPPDGNRPGRRYGWLELKNLPSLRKQLADESNQRLQKWNMEEYSFALTWPGLNFHNVRKLKAHAKQYAEEAQSLREGPARERFYIHYPVLGTVNLGQLQARVKSIRKQIAVLRTEIPAGRLVM